MRSTGLCAVAALLMSACAVGHTFPTYEAPARQSILGAIQTGNAAEVRRMFANDPGLKATSEIVIWALPHNADMSADGQAPLPKAVSARMSEVHGRRLAMVRLVVSLGADVEGRRWGETPLMVAARRGDLKAVRLLLKLGAKVDAVCSTSPSWTSGVTALIFACSVGAVPVAKELMRAGADPNYRSPRGETPLIAASRRSWRFNSLATPNPDCAGMVRLLLANGANARGPEGGAALRAARAQLVEASAPAKPSWGPGLGPRARHELRQIVAALKAAGADENR